MNLYEYNTSTSNHYDNSFFKIKHKSRQKKAINRISLWCNKFKTINLSFYVWFLRRVGSFDLSILPLPFEHTPIRPSILSLTVFQTIHILTLVSLDQFIILIVPVAFTSTMHLSPMPAPFILVIFANKCAKAFDNVGLEGALINRANWILYSSSSLSHILIKLSLVNGSIIIASPPTSI